ncbi:MAG: Pr6Pr family membrane protein [Flavobacterium sp.]|uniref:Pr6Pr family membrane protein n=1 Tax=Flavobacterium sp. TaxID=239 RepID=UPI003266586E
MKKNLALLFALIGWFAVIAQLFLMIENKITPISEAVIRFFSFFTILTNILVAIYFTGIVFIKNSNKLVHKPGVLTAITIYILMVGSVYQIALRNIWEPQGLQMVVDELLHSFIPVLVVVFWSMFEITKPVKYSQILKWMIYPVTYLIFIMVRGSFSNFYPYPFVDVVTLGMTEVLINSAILLFVFIVISVIFLFIGKSIIRR